MFLMMLVDYEFFKSVTYGVCCRADGHCDKCYKKINVLNDKHHRRQMSLTLNIINDIVAYNICCLCKIITFVAYDVCCIIGFVPYDICCLIGFVTYEVCRIMTFCHQL